MGLHFDDSEDFAGTQANKVTINGIYYNDTVFLEKSYSERVSEKYFVNGTTWKDIIFHELGHIVCNMYKINPLDIAMDILHTNLKSEVAEYVAENLSIYAATQYLSMVSNQMEFDGSEIIAESFCAYYGKTRNQFATKFLEKCINNFKEVEL